jgi:hypothetical protein
MSSWPHASPAGGNQHPVTFRPDPRFAAMRLASCRSDRQKEPRALLGSPLDVNHCWRGGVLDRTAPPRNPSAWPLVTIQTGAALFITALAASVVFEPSVWLLHTLQALIYVGVIRAGPSRQRLGFRCGLYDRPVVELRQSLRDRLHPRWN